MVSIFDGFGDADLDNNGTPLEPNDVDVSGSGGGTVDPYVALGNGGTPMLYPMDTMVNEVTAVENASDVGIRWYSIGGFTSSGTGDPRVSVHILDDSAASLPDTDPAIGYFHSVPGATRFAEAIDDGLALAAEGKGRGNTFAGFFDNRIELGPEVGDAVKVSFDFRMWYSAPNFNDQFNINHIPAIGEVRFGLFQDTDTQLGQTNPTAGVNGTPAVWGQAHGDFRGDNGTIGANGDHGWFTRIHIDDPENANFDKLPGGQESRIVEETNDQAGSSDKRILNGASDFVARPDQTNPQFVNLGIDKVYNLSMTLTRFDDPDTAGTDGDTIFAEVTVTDRATSQQWSFGNYEPVINSSTLLPDGISSDSWDYFVMGSAGASTSDDIDWLIDNFMVEIFGSNAGLTGDYNGDGKVDAADYVLWRKDPNAFGGDPQGYNDWASNFGAMAGSGAGSGSGFGAAVPEPGTLVLLGLSGVLFAFRRSSRTAS